MRFAEKGNTPEPARNLRCSPGIHIQLVLARGKDALLLFVVSATGGGAGTLFLGAVHASFGGRLVSVPLPSAAAEEPTTVKLLVNSEFNFPTKGSGRSIWF